MESKSKLKFNSHPLLTPRTLYFFLSFLLIGFNSRAGQSAAIQGRLLNSNGTPVTSSSVLFTVKVKSPGAEDCLLYQETQTLNLSTTQGAFAITLGAGTRAAATVDGGNALNTVFANSSPISLTSAISPCASAATSYTPAASDTRKVDIFFDDGSGLDQVPTITLAWIPQATYAQNSGQLGGTNSSQFLKVSAGTTPTTLTALDYISLTDLIAGTSSKYMTSSSATGTVVPSLASAPATPSAGQMWFDSVSNTMKYYNGTATQTVGTSTGLSSVGLSMPGIFSVSGSPLTANGSITATLANQTANTIFAGPSSGGAAAPTFRTLAVADLPVAAVGGLIKDGGNTLGAAITIGTNDANILNLTTNNTTRMTIDGTGNVGIGTSSPSGKLDVQGGTATSGSGSSISIVSQSGAASGNTSGGSINLTAGAANGTGTPGWINVNNVGINFAAGSVNGANPPSGFTGIYSTGSNRLDFATGGVLRYSILSTGNVVMGSASSRVVGNNFVDYSSNLNGFAMDSNGSYLKTNSTIRLAVDNSGNVGIGTSSPVANLDVVGTSQLGNIGPSSPTTLSSAAINTDTTLNVVSTSGYPSSGILYITDNASFEEAISYTGKTSSSFTGIVRGLYGSTARSWAIGTTIDLVTQVVSGANNTTAPRVFFTQTKGMGYGRIPAAWSGTGSQYSSSLMTGNGMQVSTAGAGINWGTSSTNLFAQGTSATTDYVRIITNFNEKMRIDGTGNVGINNFFPRGPLEVGKNPNTRLTANVNSSATTMSVSTNTFPASGTLIVDSEQMTYTGGGTTTFTVTRGANSTTAAGHNSTAPVSFYGQSDFILAASGNLGIGVTSPSTKLHVVGSSGATVATFADGGATTCTVTPASTGFACSSDERLKKNIENFPDSSSLENILQLRTVTYDWRSVDNGRHTGYIAQELEQIAPEFVRTGEDGLKQVNYTGLVPWITGAIKAFYLEFKTSNEIKSREIASVKSENLALKTISTKLEHENAELKNRLDQQEKELAAIKNRLGLK